jgi:hypothetical protein
MATKNQCAMGKPEQRSITFHATVLCASSAVVGERGSSAPPPRSTFAWLSSSSCVSARWSRRAGSCLRLPLRLRLHLRGLRQAWRASLSFSLGERRSGGVSSKRSVRASRLPGRPRRERNSQGARCPWQRGMAQKRAQAVKRTQGPHIRIYIYIYMYVYIYIYMCV